MDLSLYSDRVSRNPKVKLQSSIVNTGRKLRHYVGIRQFTVKFQSCQGRVDLIRKSRLLKPVWVVLSRSWSLCWRSWTALGTYVGGLGSLLEPMFAVLGRSWRLCWRSWAALGAYVGGPGPLLGPMLAVLGRLGPKLAVLGCSWDLCWRSWAVLGRKVALAQAGRRSGKRI